MQKKIMRFLKKFWDWYERHYTVNVGITAFLFTWQLVHLFWLALNPIALRLFGANLFPLDPFWQTLIIFVDYTEIPAIIMASVLYISHLRNGFSWKPLLLLIALNTQWLHLFWITDEYVVGEFAGHAHAYTILPIWLAWVAILIDYLELPVIYDTMKKFSHSLRKRREKRREMGNV